ncbi:MAG: sulfatase-like hydrolase/transferase [Pirellulaceae bacterium]
MQFSKYLCLLFLVAAFQPSFAASPNVLLICIDDLKPNLGCYGDTIARTPHIDALAARGVLFQSAYCNQAVCAPSRNSLMTGLRPQTIGIYDLATNFRNGAPDAVTMGQFFQHNGYRTEGLGKIYHRGHGNGDDAATWSLPHWNPKAPSYHLPESTKNPKVDKDGKKRFAVTERADVADDFYADGQTALEAVKRLQAAAKKPGQPFLLAVGFVKPHLPFVAPQRFWDLYDSAVLPMPSVTESPKNAPSYAATTWGELRNYRDVPAKGDLDDATTRHLIHGYYAATSYADACVGKVVGELDRLGLSENTVIVLWGDHGWHLGDHGMWCKHTNYEQAARIPLIVSLPKSMSSTTGVKSNALIETVDLYPTLASLTGFIAPEGLDGIDQSQVVKASSKSIRDHVIHVYPRGGRLGRAIRTDRYRLVQWKEIVGEDDDVQYELYDYVSDPLETENKIAELPGIAAELKKLLAQHPNPKPSVAARGKSASAKPKRDPTENKRLREGWFAKRDKDQNGLLSEAEFLAGQPEANDRFPRFDKDGDGTLSRSEYVTGGKN